MCLYFTGEAEFLIWVDHINVKMAIVEFLH